MKMEGSEDKMKQREKGKNARVRTKHLCRRSSNRSLRDTRVLPAILGVDALEVVAAGPDVVQGTLGDVRSRIMVFLTQLY